MATPNDELSRKVGDARRVRSPTGWVVGAIFLAALLGIGLFYNWNPASTGSSASKAPNGVTDSIGAAGASK